MPLHPDRHAILLGHLIQRMAAEAQDQMAPGTDPRIARQHVWDLLSIRAGPRANPNDARTFCLVAMDLLGEWSPEGLDLLFPLP